MAFVTFTREMAPALMRSTTPKVTVGEQGQIVLSRVLAEKLGSVKGAKIQYDKEKRIVVLTLSRTEDEKNFPFKARLSEKTKQVAISGGSFLSWAGYDFKKAGTQTFEHKMNAEKLQVSFVLPAETPVARPKVVRAPRAAKAPAIAQAAPKAQGASAGAAPETEDEEGLLPDEEG